MANMIDKRESSNQTEKITMYKNVLCVTQYYVIIINTTSIVCYTVLGN